MLIFIPKLPAKGEYIRSQVSVSHFCLHNKQPMQLVLTSLQYSLEANVCINASKTLCILARKFFVLLLSSVTVSGSPKPSFDLNKQTTDVTSASSWRLSNVWCNDLPWIMLRNVSSWDRTICWICKARSSGSQVIMVLEASKNKWYPNWKQHHLQDYETRFEIWKWKQNKLKQVRKLKHAKFTQHQVCLKVLSLHVAFHNELVFPCFPLFYFLSYNTQIVVRSV